jgi:hypothetical protein
MRKNVPDSSTMVLTADTRRLVCLSLVTLVSTDPFTDLIYANNIDDKANHLVKYAEG